MDTEVLPPLNWRRGLEFVLVFVAAGIAGVVLADLQQSNIRAGYLACFGHLPDLEAGGSFAATFDGITRLLCYPAATSVAATLAFAVVRARAIAYALAATVLVVAGGLIFWYDYAHHNGLLLDSWRARCPSGRPPRWPSWTGVSPSR